MHGNLTPERYEEIEEEVINMLEDCEVTQYPINPIHLAIKLRYVLRPYSLLSYKERQRAFRESKDGFSQLEEDRNGMVRFVIYYNDLSKYKRRIRWTILHEIGHCYLGHHSLQYIDKKITEEEANHFAKYAIAPPPVVKAMGVRSAKELRVVFITSQEAAEHSFEFYTGWRIHQRRHPGLTDCETRLLEMVRGLPA